MKFINIRRHSDELGEPRNTNHFYTSLFVPIFMVAILWLVKGLELAGTGIGLLPEWGFSQFGVIPRTKEGLIGLITSPFIHSDVNHLIANSIPLLVLGFLLFNTYRKLAAKVLLIVFILGNSLVWIIGRSSSHIGASGIVYGLAFFIFFSGIFRKDMRSIALALLVAFFYGSIVWGMIPHSGHISYEAHAMGALAGILAAWRYREVDRAPQFRWNDGEDGEGDDEDYLEEQGNALEGQNDQRAASKGDERGNKVVRMRYTYRPKEGENG